MTVYTTSELDPDRYTSALYSSSLRAIMAVLATSSIVLLVLRLRRRRKERQGTMDTKGPFDDS